MSFAHTSPDVSVSRPESASRARSISRYLPREHGSWSLALEPVVLALIVAPSARGAAFAVCAVALFLTRRPWQVWRSAASPAERSSAGGVCLALGSVACFTGSFALVGRLEETAVLLVPAAVGAGVFGLFDARRNGRALVAELSGGLVFAALSATIVCIDRPVTSGPVVWAVGVFALIRAATSTLTVRTYLRVRKGQDVSAIPALAAAAVALGVAMATVPLVSSWIPCAWVAFFSVRTGWLAGPWAPDWSARRIGIIEAAVGVVAVISTGIALQ